MPDTFCFAKLKSRKDVSKDTRLYMFSLPENQDGKPGRLGLPVGKHVVIAFHFKDQACTRSYTPIRPVLPEEEHPIRAEPAACFSPSSRALVGRQRGFVDPAQVLRGAHLCPAFEDGLTTEYLGPSQFRPKEGNYVAHYVLQFSDRDFAMRYYGLGVGHVKVVPHVLKQRERPVRIALEPDPPDPPAPSPAPASSAQPALAPTRAFILCMTFTCARARTCVLRARTASSAGEEHGRPVHDDELEGSDEDDEDDEDVEDEDEEDEEEEEEEIDIDDISSGSDDDEDDYSAPYYSWFTSRLESYCGFIIAWHGFDPGNLISGGSLRFADYAPMATPTAHDLDTHSRQVTESHLRSANTIRQYSTYVNAAKAWLASGAAGNDVDPQAFSRITPSTPVAARRFLAYKRVGGVNGKKCGVSSFICIRAALKDLFERELRCQGQFWMVDSATGRCYGNPIYEQEFVYYFKAVSNQDKSVAPKQSHAITADELRVLQEYLDDNFAPNDIRSSFFKVFMTLAFNLWTRPEELLSLSICHVGLNIVPNDGVPYHQISLFRPKTADHEEQRQVMLLPQDLIKHVDAFKPLNNWFEVMRAQGLSLSPADPLFPAIKQENGSIILRDTQRQDYRSTLDLFKDLCEACGMPRDEKWTLQGFRRGGAQYRFFYAPVLWEFNRCKWWGGWDAKGRTIEKYLLNLRAQVEAWQGDALLQDKLVSKEEHCCARRRTLPTQLPPKTDAMIHEGRPEAQPFPELPACVPSQETLRGQYALPWQPSQPFPALRGILDVIQCWDYAVPQKNCLKPLKLWTKADIGPHAYRYGRFKKVYYEFAVRCHGKKDGTTASRARSGLPNQKRTKVTRAQMAK
ncbi:hypothetical protein AURDEDRAFT_126672 [Auricularia subglabra TFB-10046 SS5]|nr:hypothetical protein AURDEDRAFT_126672 [Auricularia subglabra TFB-10046 SS5]